MHPRPAHSLSRRRLIGLLAAAPFAIACGASTTPPASTAPGATGASTAPAPVAKRRVDTPRGVVEVPGDPKRVVVFDRRGTLGYMLDLGIKPIAAMSAPDIYRDAFHPLILAETNGIKPLSYTEPKLDEIAGMNPDLIIGYTADSAMNKAYDQLSAIAPTVALQLDLSKPEDALTLLGKVFGREDQAAKLRTDFQNEIKTATAKIKNPGTVSIVLPIADQVRIYDATNLAGSIVTGLGAQVVPDLKTLPGGNTPGATNVGLIHVSYEQVNLITGDTIIVLVNLSAEQRAIRDKLFNSPLFQQIPAVKAKRIVEVESQANFGTAGLKGQRQILADLAKALSA